MSCKIGFSFRVRNDYNRRERHRQSVINESWICEGKAHFAEFAVLRVSRDYKTLRFGEACACSGDAKDPAKLLPFSTSMQNRSHAQAALFQAAVIKIAIIFVFHRRPRRCAGSRLDSARGFDHAYVKMWSMWSV